MRWIFTSGGDSASLVSAFKLCQVKPYSRAPLSVLSSSAFLGEPPNLTQREGLLGIEDHTRPQNVIGFYFNFR